MQNEARVKSWRIVLSQQHLFGHVLSLYQIQSLYTRDKIKLSSIPSLGPKWLMLFLLHFVQKLKKKDLSSWQIRFWECKPLKEYVSERDKSPSECTPACLLLFVICVLSTWIVTHKYQHTRWWYLYVHIDTTCTSLFWFHEIFPSFCIEMQHAVKKIRNTNLLFSCECVMNTQHKKINEAL